MHSALIKVHACRFYLKEHIEMKACRNWDLIPGVIDALLTELPGRLEFRSQFYNLCLVVNYTHLNENVKNLLKSTKTIYNYQCS